MVALPLKSILSCAYPCPAPCVTKKLVRYAPEKGLIPRGFCGAKGEADEIRLVLCLAEPGEPTNFENYDTSLPADALIDDIASRVEAGYRDSAPGFHKNVRFILDCCWPGLDFQDQLRKTWITESVLCSADKTTGPVRRIVECECASRYLTVQLNLLRDFFLIALGKKAERRLCQAGRPPDFVVRAAGRPIGSRAVAEASWSAAGRAFQEFLERIKGAGKG